MRKRKQTVSYYTHTYTNNCWMDGLIDVWINRSTGHFSQHPLSDERMYDTRQNLELHSLRITPLDSCNSWVNLSKLNNEATIVAIAAQVPQSQ